MKHKYFIASTILISLTMATSAVAMTSIECPGAECVIEVNGNVINWPDDDIYYQVQEVVVDQGRTTYKNKHAK